MFLGNAKTLKKVRTELAFIGFKLRKNFLTSLESALVVLKHRFKHNIMCVSQPWICNEGANDINGDRNNDEFRKRRKLNSRRKKQQSLKYKYPSYCQG